MNYMDLILEPNISFETEKMSLKVIFIDNFIYSLM